MELSHFSKKAINLVEVPMTVVKIINILISGETDEQHVENLTLVLEILAELGLTVNFSKCKIFEKEIEYVGFILSQHGIRMNPTTIKAVVDVPIPVQVTQLQSLLGCINYYGKFIENMSNIASPLYKLLLKDVKWR